MPDYTEGVKKEVAEIKFLIHDLRVERFINEVIHFHVTLNTDLELYGVDQAQILHGHDLQVLKAKAVSLRKSYQDYSSAVRNYSPDRTVLLAGRRYVDTLYSACELIVSPLWGRADKVLVFLPPDCRSAKGRAHYVNCIYWIRGVYHRIRQFLDEQSEKNVNEEFDIATEIEGFTRDVVYGYVMEHSGGRVQIELDRLDPAVLTGNLARFRRMYFNLVMNAVDAMSNRDVGVLTVDDVTEDNRVVLRVRDNGVGMPPAKIQQLLSDRETLDGELHSLGFVFVRQTVREFGGDLSIESEVGKGTTLTIKFPYLPGKQAPSYKSEKSTANHMSSRVVGPLGVWSGELKSSESVPLEDVRLEVEPESPAAPAVEVPKSEDRGANCGRLLLRDYEKSEAQHPGAIFAISVTEQGHAEFFSHAPYEKYWDIEHQDLSPMLYEATVRGRLEQDEEKKPILTLKAPSSVHEFFEFKSMPEDARSPELYVWMVHDEYVRIARKLIETGMSPEIRVLLDRLEKFFLENPELAKAEPFSLKLLASQRLTGEKSN